MTRRNATFAAVRWMTVSMLGRAAIGFVQIGALARILDPADFKLVAIAVTIVNIGWVFTDMGLSNAVIRFRPTTADELSSIFWLNVMLGAATTFIIAASSPFIAAFYRDSRLIPVVLIASMSFFISSFGQLNRVLAEKALQFDIVFRIETGCALLGFGVTVVTAVLAFGPLSIVFGSVASALGFSVLSWVMVADGFRPKLTFSWAKVKRFVAFGSNVVLYQIFAVIALNGDNAFGARLIPGSEFGYYFQAREFCLRIMFVVNPIVTRVSFPLLASIAHDKLQVRSVYLKAINMTASINFPIYAFLAIFAPEVVGIVLGSKWTESVPIMRVIAIWCAVRSVSNPVTSLLLATGAIKRGTIVGLGMAVAVLISVYFGAPFGILGIPIALTILYAIIIPAFWVALIRPACGASFIDYHRTLFVPALTTAIAAIAALLVLQAVNATLPRLVIGCAIGAAAYVASSWLFNRDWLKSMAELLMISRLLRKLGYVYAGRWKFPEN